LLDLAAKHPETLSALTVWHGRARRAAWRGLNSLRRDFPSADQVGDVLIFDIMGGNYRLITRVSCPIQRICVKALLTQRQYERKEWMKWA
jgi:mRNA interferase HigB